MLYRASTVRRIQREAAQREERLQRRVKELEDKLLYLIDRPWTPPPIDMVDEPYVEPEPLIEFPELSPLE